MEYKCDIESRYIKRVDEIAEQATSIRKLVKCGDLKATSTTELKTLLVYLECLDQIEETMDSIETYLFNHQLSSDFYSFKVKEEDVPF